MKDLHAALRIATRRMQGYARLNPGKGEEYELRAAQFMVGVIADMMPAIDDDDTLRNWYLDAGFVSNSKLSIKQVALNLITEGIVPYLWERYYEIQRSET